MNLFDKSYPYIHELSMDISFILVSFLHCQCLRFDKSRQITTTLWRLLKKTGCQSKLTHLFKYH